MATINLATIARLASVPSKLAEAGKIGGDVKCKTESFDTTRDNGGTLLVVNDVLRFFRVRSNEMILSLMMHHDDFGSTSAISLGLFGINGGAVISGGDGLFGGISLTSATTPEWVNFDGTGIDPAATYKNDVENSNYYTCPLWQMLGLLADPHIEYDMGGKIITANQATLAGLSLVYQYVET